MPFYIPILLSIQDTPGRLIIDIRDKGNPCLQLDIPVGREDLLPGDLGQPNFRAPAINCCSPAASLSARVQAAIAPSGIFFISALPTRFSTS